MTPLPEPAAILAAYDRRAPLGAAERPRADSIDDAYACQRGINALRESRGERRRGYKIGFTNRSIWPLYGVAQPIWAPVWDSTLALLDGADATVTAASFVEPRLEPEIVLGLSAAPSPGSGNDPDALADCIGWIANGIEIVQSPWPAWKFSAAEAIAAQGLHGRLLVGPRVEPPRAGLRAALARLRLRLFLDDRQHAQGDGTAVLDGPLDALAHLVAALASRGESLRAGDVVTTGTLTDAMPIAPGQRWRTEIDGLSLTGLRLAID